MFGGRLFIDYIAPSRYCTELLIHRFFSCNNRKKRFKNGKEGGTKLIQRMRISNKELANVG